jgi:hypothetical protein
MAAVLLLLAGATGYIYDERTKWLFVHIPRTGGTTVEVSAESVCSQEKCTVTRTCPAWTDWLRQCNFSMPRPLRGWRHAPETAARRMLALCRKSTPTTTVAIVRDPVEVRQSVWRLLRQAPNYKRSFHEYIMTGDFLTMSSVYLNTGAQWPMNVGDSSRTRTYFDPASQSTLPCGQGGVSSAGAVSLPQHVMVTRCTLLFPYAPALENASFGAHLRAAYPSLRLGARITNGALKGGAGERGYHLELSSDGRPQYPEQFREQPTAAAVAVIRHAFREDDAMWRAASARGPLRLPSARGCDEPLPYAELRRWQRETLEWLATQPGQMVAQRTQPQASRGRRPRANAHCTSRAKRPGAGRVAGSPARIEPYVAPRAGG